MEEELKQLYQSLCEARLERIRLAVALDRAQRENPSSIIRPKVHQIRHQLVDIETRIQLLESQIAAKEHQLLYDLLRGGGNA